MGINWGTSTKPCGWGLIHGLLYYSIGVHATSNQLLVTPMIEYSGTFGTLKALFSALLVKFASAYQNCSSPNNAKVSEMMVITKALVG